jgi:hypothetical protein
MNPDEILNRLREFTAMYDDTKRVRGVRISTSVSLEYNEHGDEYLFVLNTDEAGAPMESIIMQAVKLDESATDET